jgi:hypothetical protein
VNDISRMKNVKSLRCLLSPFMPEPRCDRVMVASDIFSKISIVHVLDRQTAGVRFPFNELRYARMFADWLIYLSLQSHISTTVFFLFWKKRLGVGVFITSPDDNRLRIAVPPRVKKSHFVMYITSSGPGCRSSMFGPARTCL